jgi:site-specific DNA-methyltransferase (cytosine-N4-specific)
MRSYLAGDHPMKHLEIGSEATFDDYLGHLLETFELVRNVLRDDGTLWLNLGDRYTNSGRQTYASGGVRGQVNHDKNFGTKRPEDPVGLKGKDLCMIPSRVAIALQLNGWYLRAMCPWIKRNCVPESVHDRPSTALEYFFLFSKSSDYYYDRYAVMMPVTGTAHPRSANGSRMLPENPPSQAQRRRHSSEFAWHGKGKGRRPGVGPKTEGAPAGSKMNESMQSSLVGMVTERNRRNTDWFMQSWQGMMTDDQGDPLAFVLNPKGTSLDHFAAYPPELVRPCILASTSEAGCCSKCGAPLYRIVKDGEADVAHQKKCGGNELGLYFGKAKKDYDANKVQNASDLKRRILAGMVEKKTVGWRFSCECSISQPVPCTVIDPFHGSGSTAKASTDAGRQYIGCELNEEYFKLSDARDGQGALSIL